jgi:hypothetical protein
MKICNINSINYYFIDFFIVLSVILLSKSLYYESFGKNILLIVFLFLLFFLKNISTIKINMLVLLYSLAILTVVFANNESEISSTLVLVIRILIGIIIVYFISFYKFSEIFIKIILVISIISWLSWLVIALDINSILPSFNSIDNRVLRNFIFFGVWENFIQYHVYRNSGLWWEPGAFQLFLNMAFIFAIANNTINIKRYIIFLVTLISTLSTTGFIVFLMLSFVYFRKNFILKRSTIIYLLLIIFFLLFLLISLESVLFNKFDTDNKGSFPSLLSRFYDVSISVNIFLDNIILGSGFGQLENTIPYREEFMEDELYHSSQPSGSDGVTMFISQLGIIGLILIIPLLIPKYIFHLDFINKFIISLSIFLLFNTENFTFILIFILFTFYGIIGNKKESIK